MFADCQIVLILALHVDHLHKPILLFQNYLRSSLLTSFVEEVDFLGLLIFLDGDTIHRGPSSDCSSILQSLIMSDCQ